MLNEILQWLALGVLTVWTLYVAQIAQESHIQESERQLDTLRSLLETFDECETQVETHRAESGEGGGGPQTA